MGRPQSVALVTLCLLGLLIHVRDAQAWSVPTHELLSERAAEGSILNSGVLTNLGFRDLDATISGTDFNGRPRTKSVRLWITGGAGFEDEGSVILGTARFKNHFHNPLRLWPEAGLSDILSGDSALLWAQDPLANPDWSWQGVRQSYYQALTTAQRGDREAQFARVFSGLGHVIHLIQDMSQPGHVRNDAHPLDGAQITNGAESWAKRHQNIPGDNNDVGDFARAPVFPLLSLNTGVTGDGIEPISDLWDTDQYDGSSNTIGLAAGLTVGMAEYTNANFFSEDTINSSQVKHQFPFPSVNIQDYAVCADQAPPGSFAVRRWYISRLSAIPQGICPQQGTDHFLAASFLPSPQPDSISPSLQMDDRVHEDYARQLLPRAVGYSASLINYFFRGQLGVTGSQGGLTVKNLTTETMSSGNISIYYDDPTSTRHLLSNYDLPSALNTGDQTPVIPFAIPTNNIRPGRYIVVFHGKLGEEEGAVIGKVTTEVIYYVSRRGGVDKIYRMDADGANPSRVYDNPDPTVLLAKLAPSPDAKTIAYTIATPTPPYFTIHLLNLADGTERFLTQGNWPSWSPDGSRLVFERDVGVGGIVISNSLLWRWLQDLKPSSPRCPA